MKRLLIGTGMVIAMLILTFLSRATMADENIYGLRIENINRSGADFHWSTSIETKGSITYSYTKLPEFYNPQAPGSHQDILVTATPALTESEDRYRKEHHIKIDNLDMDYCPFVQYTIKSQAFNGETYEISGEFVLVDTGKLHWWLTWWFAIFVPTLTLILGLLIPTIVRKLKKK